MYCTTQCFFDPITEDLDLVAISKCTIRLAEAAPYLSRGERKIVTKTTHAAIDEAEVMSMPIIVGASSESILGATQLCQDAEEAGGDAVLILTAIALHFTRVADASPLLIIIYNYLGPVSGFDLDSDILIRLSRVAAATKPPSKTDPGIEHIPSLAVDTDGAILFNMHRQGGEEDKVRPLQTPVPQSDWAMTKRAYHGYGGIPRQPIQELDKGAANQFLEEMEEVMKYDASLK
ncbi:hypothetical protein K469DRAFT_723032 [Zopfia rhizophila CBS 207.26]|uniref:Aldolase n=1 Tax=Zopfia rhizophila CBS 207.26 TaxID=1314779 RepID=A0A6A6EJ46_9PEZI|nr:hypothetical protein K469DRAFT_723032 [Zopfia rhizophila CBS 207.26]